MNERIKELYGKALGTAEYGFKFDPEKFAELILANYAELTRSTDPINKPFELNPKFVATCDELGRNRRQFK